MTEPGLVSLVGAGPGDPGLITLKGLARLKEADVIIHDRLANSKLLGHAKPGAELVDAGKGRATYRFSQEELNALLVEYARQGKRVCRLKGGDPFVFGRGGEEALACAEAGVPWEVVPGVTSAIAAPAYAGIPVTHRGKAAAVTFVTGSEEASHHEAGVEWKAVANTPGTLVILMGWETLEKITGALISHGVPGDRPAAVVQWGTVPGQKVVTGTISDIAAVAQKAGLGSPAVVIVGEVASLRDQLAWFDRRPLSGKRVLVTRARSQPSRLAAMLEEAGAECVEFPAISVVPLSDTAPIDAVIWRLVRHNSASGMGYDWATFTSPNGVTGFQVRLNALGLDARSLGGVKFAAVGPATAQALAGMGIRTDIVPDDYLAEAVVDSFRKRGFNGGRVAHFKSSIGRDTLPDGLRGMGADVDEIVAYETRVPDASPDEARAVFMPQNGGIDVTTFSSSSAVNNLAGLLGADAARLINGTLVACMGPVTAETARELGIRVDAVAGEQSIEGLVGSVVEMVKEGPKT
ncbi:MAG: uroporphyrinogen-III C-methyltransferase [Dehalococcoidia bacterium]|nr:uroporphyrinogen-III C-methyltransferase [Dehalococcoidia bacterium]